MLRCAAGLCRRCEAGALEALYAAVVTAQEPSTPCATKWRLRGFADGPGDPDPTVNPQPTPRVLELADGVENLTVKELVWFNKILQERFGISDAEMFGTPVAAAPAAPAAAAAEPAEEVKEEQTAFDVIVESYEATSKIKIIKEVRAMTPGLGLKEGKELVEKLPAEIKKGVSKADADEIEKKLTALGATVKIA